MKVASLVLVFVLLSAPFSMADPAEPETCEKVLRHGGRMKGTHRYGDLDIKAIKNFCELAEAAESLKTVTSAEAEACINSVAFDSVKNSGLDVPTIYDIDEVVGESVVQYHENDVKHKEHESIRASLEKGFDHFNALTGPL